MQDTNRKAKFIAPSEGARLNVLGVRHTVKVAPQDSGEDFSLHEFVVPAGSYGPPPHVHTQEDEAFYVLEGTLSFQLGEKSIRAEAGTAVFAPRGIVHRFWNDTVKDARALVYVTPAGFHGFFEGADKLAQEPVFEPDKVLSLAEGYGVVFSTERTRSAIGPNESGLRGLITGPNEGRHTPYMLGRVEVKVPSAETGGSLGVLYAAISTGQGPMTHVHQSMDEVFYVLEGEVVFLAGASTFLATKGATVYVPRGTTHSFRAVSIAPAKMISFFTPGGFEEFFFDVHALEEESGDMNIEKLMSVVARYDTNAVRDALQLADLSDDDIDALRGLATAGAR